MTILDILDKQTRVGTGVGADKDMAFKRGQAVLLRG
jgi:hypothetical protein